MLRFQRLIKQNSAMPYLHTGKELKCPYQDHPSHLKPLVSRLNPVPSRLFGSNLKYIGLSLLEPDKQVILDNLVKACYLNSTGVTQFMILRILFNVHVTEVLYVAYCCRIWIADTHWTASLSSDSQPSCRLKTTEVYTGSRNPLTMM